MVGGRRIEPHDASHAPGATNPGGSAGQVLTMTMVMRCTRPTFVYIWLPQLPSVTRVPPSTTRLCPVTNAPAAEARNSAAPATSSGCPTRRNGVFCSRRSKSASFPVNPLENGVWMSPGEIALARYCVVPIERPNCAQAARRRPSRVHRIRSPCCLAVPIYSI